MKGCVLNYGLITKIQISMNRIPPVLFQTSKEPIQTYISDMIKAQLGTNWTYEYYSDNDVLEFFRKNPIDDLPNIINIFNSFTGGPHKADLFRYYYLYIKGGVFLDSDAMIYDNIDTIIKDYEFISVDSYTVPFSIFQGILGATPKNEIIKKALYHAYNTNPLHLQYQYHYLCRELYKIIKEDTNGYNIKLFKESQTLHYGNDILDDIRVVFRHFWKIKVIPNSITGDAFYMKRYSWGPNYIVFMGDGRMEGFGPGSYVILDPTVLEAYFGGRKHIIVFYNEFKDFTSIRKDNNVIIKGHLL